jgi:hypothetical protein
MLSACAHTTGFVYLNENITGTAKQKFSHLSTQRDNNILIKVTLNFINATKRISPAISSPQVGYTGSTGPLTCTYWPNYLSLQPLLGVMGGGGWKSGSRIDILKYVQDSWGRGLRYAPPRLSTANLASFFLQNAASSLSEQLRQWNQRGCKGYRLYNQSDPLHRPSQTRGN